VEVGVGPSAGRMETRKSNAVDMKESYVENGRASAENMDSST
jgi:hypothetical protein